VEKARSDVDERTVAVEPAWAPGRVRLGVTPRHLAFLAIVALAAAWAWYPLFTVMTRSLGRGENDEHYSHIVLLPCIVAYLLWLNRQAILQRAATSLPAGALSIAIGGAVVWLEAAGLLATEPETRLAVAMIGLILMWIGGFLACYGAAALRGVLFPFAFLLFMIPLPPAFLHAVIVFLQRGSAEASAVIFGLIGMPVFRQDLTFSLPGLTILVAEECSGIRSSLALLISGLVMTYLFLRTTVARTTLAAIIIPLAIVKNAVRIVVLSWLAVHVDPSFITESVVHRTGGIPTFLVSLSVLGMLIWILRKSEQAITGVR
jgi:exosortase